MRRYKGSAITEFGPALLLLFICILVPLFDLLYLGAAFGFAYFLHNTEIRELATNTPNATAGTAALQRADTDFITNSCGAASFLGINSGNYATRVLHPGFGSTSYVAAANTFGNINPGTVTLTTSIAIRPWLYVPFFKQVPGLGSDMVFAFTDTKPEDENGQN